MSELKTKEPLVRIIKRDKSSFGYKVWVRAAAILLALVVDAIFIYSVTGLNPLSVYVVMFNGTFMTSIRFSWAMRDLVTLLCIGIALAPAFKMHFWNIGAEGQVLVGGLATAMVMVKCGASLPTPVLFLVMFLTSVIAGGLWGFIPAVFKAYWNTNETLFTLMMNYIATQLSAFFIIVWEVPKGAGKIGINQPGQNSSEHDSEDTPEENDNASGTGNAAKSKKGKSRKEGFNLKDEVISWIQVLVAAAIIAFCVNHFIIANSEVPTSSMETTIMAGDRVIGSRLSYKFGDPQRGDIAIFIYPDDEAKGIKTYYVKRIIGMPGDTIDIVDGKVYLNGSDTPLDEPYLHEPMEPEEPQHYEVPDGCYFMLGDNRNYSNDARRWTHKYVKRDKLVAKVLFQYFPKIQKLN